MVGSNQTVRNPASLDPRTEEVDLKLDLVGPTDRIQHLLDDLSNLSHQHGVDFSAQVLGSGEDEIHLRIGANLHMLDEVRGIVLRAIEGSSFDITPDSHARLLNDHDW